MYRAKVEPMPENDAKVGETSGLWRVVVYEFEENTNAPERIAKSHADNLAHNEAVHIAEELQNNFNQSLNNSA
jgi:hypothetical protein